MKANAVLLTSCETPEIQHAAKILRFFGIGSSCLNVEEFLVPQCTTNGKDSENSPKVRLLCSSDTLAELLAQIEKSRENIAWWRAHTHSVFVYAGEDPCSVEQLVRMLSSDDSATVDRVSPGVKKFTVADDTNGFSGVMAGINGTASVAGMANSYVLRRSSASLIDIVSIDEGATFLKLTYHDVPVFLSTSTCIIDIDTPLVNGIFDIRDHVSTALPIVLFVKWAFSHSCWNPAETGACLMIDDPLLKPAHGFINFRELLSLMTRHKFSTNIAFIPWNWRRSSPETVRLFRENSKNYSISVHGCDHNRAEFGTREPERLQEKVHEAVQRMDQHERDNGMPYDKVMVFPQGVFSKAAISALKRTDFVAAVNNDTIAVDSEPDAITVANFWNVAVMNYDNFPIFTRRYPWKGVENFAFDILLGKPALIVIHHDYCRDHCAALIQFVERLNGLRRPLKWGSLGQVIRTSYKQRKLSPTLVELEMYGSELELENSSDSRRRYLVRRRELQPSDIAEVRTEDAKLNWETMDGHIHFEFELDPGESEVLTIRFRELKVNTRQNSPLYRRAGTALRRYLCEARDNYFVPGKHRISRLLNGRVDGRGQREEG